MNALDIPLQKRLCLALDTPDLDTAIDLIRRTRHAVGTYKVGLELFSAHGPAALHRIRREDVDIFLDLKLHDIPNTVAGAVREAVRHEVTLLTIHGMGGARMLRAAQAALSAHTELPGRPPTRLLAVTVLTHHTSAELAELGINEPALEMAQRLAGFAAESGLFGCVCSPHEIAALRAVAGAGFGIVCPGIRSVNAPLDDQARTATAREALRTGADYIVVGRPIRQSLDPAAAAAAILEEMALGPRERNS